MGKTRLAESVGHRLLGISTALCPLRVASYITKALLCLIPGNSLKKQPRKINSPLSVGT